LLVTSVLGAILIILAIVSIVFVSGTNTESVQVLDYIPLPPNNTLDSTLATTTEPHLKAHITAFVDRRNP
jgi:hypothetical protein